MPCALAQVLFTAIAIASIAVGIGANTAIFTLVDQVLLRALPVKNPSALVQVTYRGSAFGSNWGDEASCVTRCTDFRDNNQVFDGMFCRFSYPMPTGYGGRTERRRRDRLGDVLSTFSASRRRPMLLRQTTTRLRVDIPSLC